MDAEGPSPEILSAPAKNLRVLSAVAMAEALRTALDSSNRPRKGSLRVDFIIQLWRVSIRRAKEAPMICGDATLGDTPLVQSKLIGTVQ